MKTTVNRFESFWRAAETGNLVAVSELLRNGVDVDAANGNGTTALMSAVAAGRMQIVSVLLEHGANPNGTRKDGFTPLLLAAFFGHAEIVKSLIEHGANSEATTRFGTSAQMWASARTFHEVVDYLETQQHEPRFVKEVKSVQMPAGEMVDPKFVDSSEDLFIVQKPAVAKKYAALAFALSGAVVLGGAMITRVKLWPKEPVNTKTIQSVAAAERVRTTEEVRTPATVVAQEPATKADNNHPTAPPVNQANERKTNLSKVTAMRSTLRETSPAEITTEPADVQPLPIAPVEVQKSVNVITPNPNGNSVPSRIPINNNQLISPKGSSKSGKVIPWP